MEVILYYMKLEDKYWALYLAGLFLLTACALVYTDGRQDGLSADKKQGAFSAFGERSNQKTAVFTIWYGIAAYLIFLCPLTYHIITSLVPALDGYYELSHIRLMPVIISFAFAAAAGMLGGKGNDRVENLKNPTEEKKSVGKPIDGGTEERDGRRRLLLLTTGFVIILFFAGHLVYLFPDGDTFLTAGVSAQTKEALDEEQQVYDLLLADAAECGKTTVRFWGPDALMYKSRLYNAVFRPIYGKDIAQKPENYNDQTVQLYQAYQSYDSERTQVVNVKEQLDAIANFPKLYPETECGYVIIYDPATQFEDFNENWEDTDYDPVLNFEQIGYTLVGRTSSYLVFRADS